MKIADLHPLSCAPDEFHPLGKPTVCVMVKSRIIYDNMYIYI